MFYFNHTLTGALPFGKYFMESKISETVIINATTVLECFRPLHARSAPRSQVTVSGKIQSKRLKLYFLTHLYVKM